MSKKFDEEYLTFLRDSSPDIWDRIEKNLDKNPKREMPKKKKRSISKKISYFALPIAACIIIAIAIPMWLGSIRMASNGTTNSDVAPMEEDVNTMMEECAESEMKKAEDMTANTEDFLEDCDEACDEVFDEDCAVECVVGEAAPMVFEVQIKIISRVDEEIDDSDLYQVQIIWNAEEILKEGNLVLLYTQQENSLMEVRNEYHVMMEEKEDGYLLVEILE